MRAIVYTHAALYDYVGTVEQTDAGVAELCVGIANGAACDALEDCSFNGKACGPSEDATDRLGSITSRAASARRGGGGGGSEEEGDAGAIAAGILVPLAVLVCCYAAYAMGYIGGGGGGGATQKYDPYAAPAATAQRKSVFAGASPMAPAGANAAPAADAPLPPGWQAVTDPGSGDTYYRNENSGEVSWDRPTGGLV